MKWKMKRNFSKFLISQIFSRVLLFLASTLMKILVVTPWLFHQYSPQTEIGAVITSLSRPLWAISIIFVINCCVNGDCESLNRFLSLHIWRILARMGLSLYLTSGAMQLVRIAYRYEPMEFNGYFGYVSLKF